MRWDGQGCMLRVTRGKDVGVMGGLADREINTASPPPLIPGKPVSMHQPAVPQQEGDFPINKARLTVPRVFSCFAVLSTTT